uniref:Secreted protein n=1 Tax=Parastrongyloides trichosuri TaxID=131310 RepID=A0A0N4ZQZ0_PARTI
MKLFFISTAGTIFLIFLMGSMLPEGTSSPINDYLKADFEEDQLFILRKPTLDKEKKAKSNFKSTISKSTTKKVNKNIVKTTRH